jgi:hypothetical protein
MHAIRFLVVSFVMATPWLALGNTWKQTKNSDGIEVFAREKSGSNFSQVRATLQVPVEPELIVPFLQDIEGQKKWVAECKASSVVGAKASPWDFAVYNVVGIPWPFEDRDTVYKTKVRRLPAEKGFVMFLRSVPNAPSAPTPKGVVRMKSFEAQWLLERLPSQAGTKIDFRLHLDPGGNLTPVFVNLTASSLQYTTLKNLQALLADTSSLIRLSAEVPEVGPIDPSVEQD